MNFFKIKTTWSNVELAIFKICVASGGVLVGAYFQKFISSYYVPIIIIFAVTYILTGYLWLTKMKGKNSK
jgi:hypothetical protein